MNLVACNDSDVQPKAPCRPEHVTERADEKRRPWEMACEHCGYDVGNGWHDGQIVEIEVECPRCRRDIACLSAYLSLQTSSAWEIGLGRDRYDAAAYKSVPGSGRSTEIDVQQHPQTRKFLLTCPGKRCGYRRLVGYARAGDAMVKAWRARSHKVVAGIDL